MILSFSSLASVVGFGCVMMDVWVALFFIVCSADAGPWRRIIFCSRHSSPKTVIFLTLASSFSPICTPYHLPRAHDRRTSSHGGQVRERDNLSLAPMQKIRMKIWNIALTLDPRYHISISPWRPDETALGYIYVLHSVEPMWMTEYRPIPN